MLLLRAVLLSFLIMLQAVSVFAAGDVTVFAAASLTNVMDEIIAEYNKANKSNVIASYAASGALARQIADGAPAGIFISADPKWVDDLQTKKLINAKDRMDYLGNDLVLITNIKSTITFKFGSGKKLNSLLKKSDRFVLGDPEYVPAGKYTVEALTYLGEWAALKPQAAYSDNVRGVLTLIEKAEAPLGAVYGSDAAASKEVKVLDAFPDGSFSKIVYPIALISTQETPDARKFYEYLTDKNSPVKAVFSKHGLTPLW
jgi:molybdate transport system substrate-binding protein